MQYAIFFNALPPYLGAYAPAGGGRRGEAQDGEQTRGTSSALCPPPNLPPLESA